MLDGFSVKLLQFWMRVKKPVVYVVIGIVLLSVIWIYSEHSFNTYGELSPATHIGDITDVPYVQNLNDIHEKTDIAGISIQFATYAGISDGELTVKFLEDGKTLQDWNIQAERLADGYYHTFYLDHDFEVGETNDYSISVEYQADAEHPLAFWLNDNEMICYQIVGANSNSRIVFLCVYSIVFAVVFIISLKTKNEFKIMALVLTIVWIMFVGMFPANNLPDEPAQFYRAYEVSTGHMISEHLGFKGEGGRIMPSALVNYMYSDPATEIDENDQMGILYPNTALYSPVNYVPQAIGIRIARLFSNKIHDAYIGAKIANSIFTLTICLAALYYIPFSKRLLLLIMLFPTSLQQMTSISADGITLCLAFFLVAYILHVIYRDGALKKRDLVIIALLCVVISLLKIIYVVLVLLVFAIPKHKYSSKNQMLGYRIGVTALAISLNLIWLKISSGFLLEFTPGVDSGAQVKYVLLNILNYYSVVIRTFLKNGAEYIYSMIGSALGCYSININDFVWIAFLALVIREAHKGKGLSTKEDSRIACFFLLAFLAGAALIFTSLYVQWTPYSHAYVEGIQGRYFSPLMPELVIALIVLDRRKNENVFAQNNCLFYSALLTLQGIVFLDVVSHFV